MTKREKALAICKIAGYHGDSKGFTRAYIENKLSYQAAQQAYTQGIREKDAGVPCTCYACNKKE